MNEHQNETKYPLKVCEIRYEGTMVPATIRNGVGSMYRTPQYKQFREIIGWLYKGAYDGECKENRLYRVDVMMCQNMDGSKRKNYRCDIDNLAKPILDSATGIIWKDDNQVSELRLVIDRMASEDGFVAIVYETSEWHANKMTLICPNCKKEFVRNRAMVLNHGAKYCSRQCMDEFRRVKRTCLHCGSEFTYRRSAQRGTQYCSSACYHAYMKDHPDDFIAIQNNLKKAAATPKERNSKGQFKRKSYSLSHSLIRKLMERSGGICEECQSPPDWRGLSPHHIIHKSQGGKDVIENLMLVCGKCHSAKHGIREV